MHLQQQKFQSPGSSDGSRVTDGTTNSCSSITAAATATTAIAATVGAAPAAATSTADTGGSAEDGRALQQQDGRPRSRENQTGAQDAHGGGLDAVAAATVAEGSTPQEAETGA